MRCLIDQRTLDGMTIRSRHVASTLMPIVYGKNTIQLLSVFVMLV